MSFSILIASVALVFNSCGTSKKVVNEPVSEVVAVEEVAEEINTDTILVIETISESENIIAEIINHSEWDNLLQKYVTINGNVDYKGFKKEPVKIKFVLNLSIK